MKFKSIYERGQALVIIAVGMVALIAMAGLAIDGSNTFADRRAAQNAADTAALAGAVMRNNLEKGDNSQTPPVPPESQADCIEPPASVPKSSWPNCWSTVVNAALDRAGSNGYTGDITNSTVEVHSPPIDGPYATCTNMPCDPHNYIQVIIHTNVYTFFAKVIGIGQTHNRVEAVALSNYRTAGPLYSGNSLVSLAPGNTGSNCGTNAGFIVAGSGTVNVSGGGVFVNSDNSGCAFNQNGCNTTLNITGGGISVVGGSNLQGSCSGNISPAPISNAQQIDLPPPYPFKEDPPTECSMTPATPGLEADGITLDYHQGYYATFPPSSGKYNNIHMTSGVYCVSNVVKVNSPNTVLSGSDVFIYIMPGGSFDFQGGTLNLSAPTAGDYKGYLIYVDFTYPPSNPMPACIINGNTADSLTGAIVAPYCNITINGTSGSNPGIHSQIIGYTITLSGSNEFNFIYNASEQPTDPGANNAGIYR